MKLKAFHLFPEIKYVNEARDNLIDNLSWKIAGNIRLRLRLELVCLSLR